MYCIRKVVKTLKFMKHWLDDIRRQSSYNPVTKFIGKLTFLVLQALYKFGITGPQLYCVLGQPTRQRGHFPFRARQNVDPTNSPHDVASLGSSYITLPGSKHK